MNIAGFSIENYKIEDLVPHSPPMVLIDKIVSFSDTKLCAEVHITSASQFFDANLKGVPVWFGLEYMAQSIAALAGIHAKVKSQAVKLGFLLGSRRYNIIQDHFSVGNVYQVNIEQLYKDDSGMGCFNCKISCGQEVLVTSKLNVFEVNDLDSVLEG
jgi:predicted hotdog family 3-hydroxylacyl-ACP dehydratase